MLDQIRAVRGFFTLVICISLIGSFAAPLRIDANSSRAESYSLGVRGAQLEQRVRLGIDSFLRNPAIFLYGLAHFDADVEEVIEILVSQAHSKQVDAKTSVRVPFSSTQKLIHSHFTQRDVLSRFEDKVSRLRESQNRMSGLLNEIMAFSGSRSIMPRQLYEKYTVRELAQALVVRKSILEGDEETKKSSDPSQDYFHPLEKLRPVVFFHGRDLETILRQGFLNQHVTRQSSGLLAPRRRARVENQMIRAALEVRYRSYRDSIVHQLRPIYGNHFFEFDLYPRSTDTLYGRLASKYGSVTAELFEDVKWRSSWNPGDSILIPEQVRTFFTSASRTVQFRHYIDLQVWGGLSLEDIQAFWVSSHVSPDVLSLLKKTGRPIWEYEYVSRGNGSYSIRTPVKLIYAGNPDVLRGIKDRQKAWALVRYPSFDAEFEKRAGFLGESFSDSGRECARLIQNTGL